MIGYDLKRFFWFLFALGCFVGGCGIAVGSYAARHIKISVDVK